MPTTPVRAPNERSGDRPTDKPGAHPADKPRAAAKAAAPDAKAAGLAVWARDTGRVLLLQRALNPDDPAAGMWEFPGGCAEDGEDPLTAAQREWAEEVGQPVPAGTLAASWTAGRYVGHVWAIPTETDVTINADPDDRHVLNPDDPDGDEIEVVAWWDPGHLAGNPALRRELAASMPAVRGAFATAADGETAAKTAEAGQFRTFVAHLRKDERRFRPFQFDHHPGYIAQAANDLAAAGEYAAAMAVLDVVVAA
jgi:8-oxo-dGTP pyrophosphatase MutT (NUDIX family)